ncbi:hypothetical protein R3P38DRAFT_1234350 [Favolaschia claudopus]|uniref:Secreted protein n=1 Tax=Favolaschia claudopus TaxID=2862362 RepID=A0AAW0B1T9_9AGAR
MFYLILLVGIAVNVGTGRPRLKLHSIRTKALSALMPWPHILKPLPEKRTVSVYLSCLDPAQQPTRTRKASLEIICMSSALLKYLRKIKVSSASPLP